MSRYVSPYSYRLPPDTMLQRRDPSWYIGSASMSEADKRRALADSGTQALYKMADTLDAVINAQLSLITIAGKAVVGSMVPGLGLIVLASAKNAAEAREYLIVARDKIRKPDPRLMSPVESVVAVANDVSLSFDQAVSRIEYFLTEYARSLDGQIKLAQSSAPIFANAVKAFGSGIETVLSKTSETILPSKSIPLWVWAAGGLAGLFAIAYIAGKVR